MIKVVSIVLNNFTNDSRVLKEAISLQNHGYEVNVVALHEEPLKEFEEIQKINVHRIKLRSRNWSKNRIVQIIKYIEFIFKSIRRYKESDIIHCNDLNTLPIGVIMKKFFNKNLKIIYDAHEYETEVNYLVGVRKKLSKITEKFLIKYADRVITVSDGIADEYVRLYNIPKPHLVLNTPPYQEREKKDIFRKIFDIKKEQSIFLYQGNLSGGRGVEVVLETFKNLDQNHTVVFMGYGQLEALIKEYAKRYNNIYFHDAVTPDILLDYTSSADFGISMIEDVCLSYHYCLPNKMFEYIMAGVPVIVSNLPEMKKVIEEYEVGVIAKENSEEGLKEAIIKASSLDRNHLTKKLNRVKSIYNWEEQERVLLALYRGVING